MSGFQGVIRDIRIGQISGLVLKSRFVRWLFVYSDLRCIDFSRMPYMCITVYVDLNSGGLM